MTDFLFALLTLAGFVAVWAAISALIATISMIYYRIRDGQCTYKWWLQVFHDVFTLLPVKSLPFFGSGSSSRRSGGFGGGSSRGGGSGMKF